MRILLIYRAKNDSHTTSYKFVCRYTHVYMKVARSGLSLIPHSCFRCEKNTSTTARILSPPKRLPLGSPVLKVAKIEKSKNSNRTGDDHKKDGKCVNLETSLPLFPLAIVPLALSFPSFHRPYDIKERGLNRFKNVLRPVCRGGRSRVREPYPEAFNTTRDVLNPTLPLLCCQI